MSTLQLIALFFFDFMLARQISSKTRLNFLLIVILIIGFFFRFFNLSAKDYWNDEVYTSLRISGYRESEIVQEIFNGRQISVEELRRYQSVNSEKNLSNTIQGLAQDEAQLPPFYFVLARFWTQWFGSSIAVTRSLSAVISLLVFPCLYWLCLELFNSSFVAAIAIVLVAISPFHVLYAQEARMYSLWSVQFLLSSAAFLRAVRLNSKASWIIYSATLILGLYTHLFSSLATLGNGIYLVITENFKATKRLFFYFLSVAIALLAFFPWLVVILTNSSGVETALAWLKKPSTFWERFWNFLDNLCKAFIDLGSLEKVSIFIYLNILLLILIGYSFYFLCRYSSKKTWLFILILTAIIPLFLIVGDLLTNSRSLGHARYIVPSYFGLQISLAYLFANQLNSRSLALWKKNAWRLIIALLVTSGILSCWISSQAETWANKYNSNQQPIARIVNQCDRPLIISDSTFAQVLSLSHWLDPKVKLQLLNQTNISQLTDDFNNFSDTFLFKPSKTLKETIDKQLNKKRETVRKTGGLWQIKN
jgi:uncharacterized membrane protein